MKTLLKASCCLAALSSSVQANPLTFPAPGMWHFTAGAETGIESFKILYVNGQGSGTFANEFYGSAYALGFNQSVGYGSWFYLQIKESGAIATTTTLVSSHARPKSIGFFDVDLRAYFPCAISQTHRVTLQPLVGVAGHFNNIKMQDAGEGADYMAAKSRSLAPMVGLALGLEPTPAFSLRTALAFEFAAVKQKTATLSGTTVTTSAWERPHRHRLALNASLDMCYQVGPRADITGSLTYLSHSPVDVIGPTRTATFDTNYSSRTGAKVGVMWHF